MKNDKHIAIFYTLYFGWLFTLTTLTVDVKLQNYFAILVVIFYFIFLREYWDPLIFTFVSLVVILLSIGSIESGIFKLEIELLKDIPIWLPLSWGTTILALKKFYLVMIEKIHEKHS